MDILKYLHERTSWFSQVIYVTLNLFFKTKMQNHAAAVAYYSLLSIAPLMLFVTYLLNMHFQGYPEVLRAFAEILVTLHLDFLNTDSIGKMHAISGMLSFSGGVSLLILLWSSKGLMKSVQSAFAVIFADSSKRNFMLSLILSFLSMPFLFLLLAASMYGDYQASHYDYASVGIPFLAKLLKFSLRMTGLFAPFLGIWAIVFLLYLQIPHNRPRLSSTLIYSFFCTASVYALEMLFAHVVRIEQYISLYGSLGDIIFVLIWVYFGFIQFFLWAQFLYVAGRIDVIALEKIFLASEERTRLEHRIDDYLFSRSSRIFRKYGQSCSKGETIIRQNDDTASIYYLYSGQVGLYRENNGTEIRMGGLRPGEIFGEMAYLLGERRTATVVAETDCFLFILSPETLEALMGYSTKLSRRIIESLCQRIAKMNKGVLVSGFASSTHKLPVFKPGAGAV